MDTVNEKAAYYRIGLFLGVFTIDEIISWCDSEILLSDKPNHKLIDISLMKNPKIILESLSELSENEDEIIALRKVLGTMYTIVSEDIKLSKGFAKQLNLLSHQLERKYGISDDLIEIQHFDEDFYQAEYSKQKYIIHTEFLEFLKPFTEIR